MAAIPPIEPTAACAAKLFPYSNANKNEIGPELSGSPVKIPLTRCPHLRPASVSSNVKTGVKKSFSANSISDLLGLPHYLHLVLQDAKKPTAQFDPGDVPLSVLVMHDDAIHELTARGVPKKRSFEKMPMLAPFDLQLIARCPRVEHLFGAPVLPQHRAKRKKEDGCESKREEYVQIDIEWHPVSPPPLYTRMELSPR